MPADPADDDRRADRPGPVSEHRPRLAATARTSPASSPPTARPVPTTSASPRRHPRLLLDRRGAVHHRRRHRLRLHARPARPVGHRRRQQLVGQQLPRSSTRTTRWTSPPRPSPTRASTSSSPPATPATGTPRPRLNPFCQSPWVISVAAEHASTTSAATSPRTASCSTTRTAATADADGHTTFTGERIGLVHPDVTAPGVDISSTCDTVGTARRPVPARGEHRRLRHVAWPRRTSPAPSRCSCRPTRSSRSRRCAGVLQMTAKPVKALDADGAVTATGARSGRSATAGCDLGRGRGWPPGTLPPSPTSAPTMTRLNDQGPRRRPATGCCAATSPRWAAPPASLRHRRPHRSRSPVTRRRPRPARRRGLPRRSRPSASGSASRATRSW